MTKTVAVTGAGRALKRSPRRYSAEYAGGCPGLDDIVSLDPAEANELSSIQTVPSLYQRLVQPDRDNPEKITPILAESWEADAAAKPDHQA
jgi:ABC-type transport system substrate-binding protein